eukprot:TRINITY_DN25745_c0_g1_i2.p1 TRINITY_DN25745_c0_g1~~TRINITY_DN25745_c0_g1_i2.p1  ORF type:complete len:146 (-),score=2.87 TRINITY_DN25745_c0_g1_i2:74-511(-)
MHATSHEQCYDLVFGETGDIHYLKLLFSIIERNLRIPMGVLDLQCVAGEHEWKIHERCESVVAGVRAYAQRLSLRSNERFGLRIAVQPSSSRRAQHSVKVLSPSTPIKRTRRVRSLFYWSLEENPIRRCTEQRQKNHRGKKESSD